MPEFFESLLEDVQENIFDVFDIREFAVRKMTLDKSLTNNIFLKCGAKEFKFIEYSGFIFGFIFGVFQVRYVHWPIRRPRHLSIYRSVFRGI